MHSPTPAPGEPGFQQPPTPRTMCYRLLCTFLEIHYPKISRIKPLIRTDFASASIEKGKKTT